MIKLELLSKSQCYLCEEMKRVLSRATQGIDVNLREVDIELEPELLERYGEQIPVLFVNGVEVFKHCVTEGKLRSHLLHEIGE